LAREIPIGTRGEAEETVEFEHTLTSHHAELPPVYSTPDMIRLMETAAFQALQPYCEGDEITVGTSINIEHRATSGIGACIKAVAELESFDGRFYTLRVSARDDAREIGRGTVGRAVVSVGKFAERMKNANCEESVSQRRMTNPEQHKKADMNAFMNSSRKTEN